LYNYLNVSEMMFDEMGTIVVIEIGSADNWAWNEEDCSREDSF